MEISIDRLKLVQSKLNHIWFDDRPNIIAIRTKLYVPDVFNDLLCLVYRNEGKEEIKIYPVTTVPGVHYQKKLLNPRGCAVVALGQHIDSYSLGFHQGREDHRCFRQTGNLVLIRDKDLDGVPGNSGLSVKDRDSGCNIHGATKFTTTKRVGPWSAGCTVHAKWSNKEEMCDVGEKFRVVTNNKFTYTIVSETDL